MLGDLLTAYDGSAITYDGVGNPLSYRGWTFTWERGRQLATATNGSTTVSYTYDADGLRTSKTVNGVVYTYYYVGSQLARMTYGDYVLDFFYDANGTPIAMRQGYASSSNYTVYYYITNLQGDVIRLVDVNGSTAAYYEYDPYGNAIQAAGSHCNINPLRYRGYVYDQETNLYYLQSRYYNPEWGRFINADALVSTGQGLLGNNMFAYCNNNPVCFVDPTGHALMQICFDTSGASDMLRPGAWGGGGGGGGAAYAAGAAASTPSVNLKELLNDAAESVKSIAEAGWDAYMQGYALEQESIRFQAQANIDAFDSIGDTMHSIGVVRATGTFAAAAYNVASAVIIVKAAPLAIATKGLLLVVAGFDLVSSVF